ncbi:hypothetical protein Tco_0003760 [Tanacetum coccineum]
MEGLGHNMFSVGQFCDSDLKVAFRKHSCYVRDTNGVELIKGSRGSNLYPISVEDMIKSSGNGYSLKDKNEAKIDKKNHSMICRRDSLGKSKTKHNAHQTQNYWRSS